MRRYGGLVIILFISQAFLSFFINAQVIHFTPPVYNYSTKNYDADNQNWAIAQDKNGVVYFGNNNGLLSFDGVNWELHPLSNNLSVKSIFIDDHNNSAERIYVGSFEEFGYFERNEIRELIYHSLKEKVMDYNFHNDEIWSIHSFGDKTYFQSFSRIFVYDGDDIDIIDPNPAVLYFFHIGDKMYAQLINFGLALFNGESFVEVVDRESVGDDDIVSMLEIDNELLLTTSKSGIYRFYEDVNVVVPWETDLDDELKEAVINRAVKMDSSQFIVGTINKGVYALNGKGEILWNINRSTGLNNNTVLALAGGSDGSVWAALDNGISNIRVSSPFTILESTDLQIGLVEDILFYNDEVYLATNQGVYHYSPFNSNFDSHPLLDAQTWFIKRFDEQIFIGHNFGTSMLVNNRAVPVYGAHTGGMDMKQVTINGQNILLEASYTSLYVYKKNSLGLWSFSHPIEGFSDLIKGIEVDHAGNVWADHMYKGVYRLKLDKDLNSVADGMVESFPQINLMKLKGRVVFTDGVNFYTYDDIRQDVILFELINSSLPGLADTYRIVPVADDIFWFIRNDEFTLVRYTDGRYVVEDRIPFSILNNPPNVGRANVFVSDSGISYFSLNGGLGRYILRSKEVAEVVPTYLQFSSIRYYSRDDEEYKLLNPNLKGVLEFEFNNIDFHFSYPEFSKSKFRVETFLEDYDNRWINADPFLTVSYNNLPAGSYVLYARVFDSSESVVSSIQYSFEVKNPWYKTWYAYLSYISLLLFIVGIVSINHIKKIIRKKSEFFAKQESRRLIEIEQKDKQIIKLRAEKLEADLTYKGKELASATMLIINHTEFLKRLKEHIQQSTLQGKINRSESVVLQNMIESDISEDDVWTVFQENFDLIHENFFRNLKQAYPSLTPIDLKLCALLRLNYSTKEIAGLLNISVRGVESARYRIRKKLELDEHDNLIEFFINFK